MQYQDQAAAMPSAEMPETIEINGVTYRRDANDIDHLVNTIRKYQEVAQRTGLPLRKVVWFHKGDHSAPMPD